MLELRSKLSRTGSELVGKRQLCCKLAVLPQSCSVHPTDESVSTFFSTEHSYKYSKNTVVMGLGSGHGSKKSVRQVHTIMTVTHADARTCVHA